MKRFLLNLFLSLIPFATILAETDRSLPSASPRKVVALLFDDGPHATNSVRLLKILGDTGIRASFAQIGNNVHSHPALTRAMDRAGHQILNHSMTHGDIGEMDDAALRQEILAPLAVFESAMSKRPAVYWPPFIKRDSRMPAIVKEGDMRLLVPEGLNFVSSEDWNVETTPRDGILHNALRGLDDPTLELGGDRRLILFHEWRDDTLAVLPEIVSELKDRGYTFVTIDQLLASQPGEGKSSEGP